MNILITGAKGFIGSNLMGYLKKENTVIGISRYVMEGENGYVGLDLSKPFDISFNADIVIHAAALPPLPGAVFTDYYYNNVIATENVISYCLKHKVKKIVYFAAVSSYGKVDKILDGNSPHNDPDEYGLTKYVAEKMVMDSKIPYLVLTLPGVVGPGCNNNWIMCTAKKLWQGQQVVCYNKDGLFNNIVEISDLCRFVDVLIKKDIVNENYMLCASESWKTGDIILYMQSKLKSKSDIIWSVNNSAFIIDSNKIMGIGFIFKDMEQILEGVCEEAMAIMKRGAVNMKEDKNWREVKEVLNNELNDFDKDKLILGTYYTNMFFGDIKHMSFTLSRYKFASKLVMYQDKTSVLELGCQEAVGSLVFEQNTNLEKYVGIDFDHDAMLWNYNNLSNEKFVFIEDNFLQCNEIENQKFDVVLSLDVIEHIDKKFEDHFCRVVSSHIKNSGVAIIGTPAVYMDPYACDASKAGHINLYDQKRLYSLMNKYFTNVFIFNMNDEIVHTGFAPMSCYIFAVCTGKK